MNGSARSRIEAYTLKLAKSALEREPLYRKIRVTELPVSTTGIRPRLIEFHCPKCRLSRPFVNTQQQGSGAGRGGPPALDSAVYAFLYGCTACGLTFHTWVEFNVNQLWFRKVGQIPPLEIAPPGMIEAQLLEPDLTHYKRGLACVSQSYGIGALGYFRRVLEDTIDTLLDLVEQAARGQEDEDLIEAVGRAKKEKNVAAKLRLVKDVIPPALRPGGVNPLAVLYDEYSKGLHRQSDDECLEIALQLRHAFEYLFAHLRQHIRAAEEFGKVIRARGSENAPHDS